MNAVKIVTTALSCARILLVATSATVRMDTHWTLMNTLAMVQIINLLLVCIVEAYGYHNLTYFHRCK